MPRTTKFAAVAACLLVAAAACTGQPRDRAGGMAGNEPTVLRLAQGAGAVPPQLDVWAKQVSRLSGGSLKIEFANSWRSGQPDFEQGVISDVKAGVVDLAWVGARAFDTAGVDSFQALLAPLLIDSIDLEAEVFAKGIPAQMLVGAESVGVVGIGVLPGPLRRMLGRDTAFTTPSAFRDKMIAINQSEVATATMEVLGARPYPVPGTGAEIAPFEGYEQQLLSIWRNHYEAFSHSVTANVNLWPRPLVVLMGWNAYAKLTAKQQDLLRTAIKDTVGPALEVSRTEDKDAMPGLCQAGLSFAVASDQNLRDLRSAVEPVYRRLRSDPDTKRWLEEITALKAGRGPDIATCDKTVKSPVPDASGIPDGTYQRTMTADDYLKSSDPGISWFKPPRGEWRITFNDGLLTRIAPDGELERWTYRLFRGRINARGAVTIDATFSRRADELTFSNFTFVGDCPDCGKYEITLGGTKKPWIRQP